MFKWFGNMKIGKKLNFIVIMMLLLVVVIAVGFSIIEFTSMNIKQAQEQAQKGVAGMTKQIENYKDEAKELSALVAADPEIIEGTLKIDREKIGQALNNITPYIGSYSISILDKAGTVIYRTNDPTQYGDSLAGREDVLGAKSGESISIVGKGIDTVLSVSAGFPIKDSQGNIVGVVTTAIKLDNSEALDSLKEIYKTEMTIFQDDKRVATTIMNSGKRAVGTNLDPKVADIVLEKKSVYAGTAIILGKEYITYYSPILSSDGTAIGILFAGQSIDEFYQNLNRIILIVVVISVVSIVAVLILFMILIRKSVTKPVKIAAGLANALASGDLDKDISIKTNDEIGQLTKVLDGEVRNAFKNIEKNRIISEKQSRYQSKHVDNLVANLERLSSGELYCDMAADEPDEDTAELYDLFGRISDNLHLTVNTLKTYIEEISEALNSMSSGDLNVSIDSDYRGDFIALKDSINGIAASLSATLLDINTAADQVASGSRQVSDGVQQTSQGATEQASSIEELTASIAQIAQQTKQNAMSANKANELTVSAVSDAARGNDQMKAMQMAMGDISESSQSIGKIIKVIDDIAFQTNILALNAAVEAARAGIHGKGFAVVAEEVRNLAARSANAAKETTDLIEGSINKTEAGTKIADETVKALSSIVEGVDKAAQLVSEIARASNEQAGAIAQVNSGIEQMSLVVQTNSATAEEGAAASEELSSQAELLKNMVGRFRLKAKAGHGSEAPAVKPQESVTKEHYKTPVINISDADFGKY